MGTKKRKRIIVVGAGPGGLTAAMLLATRGFDVTIYEKEPQAGGRNGELRLGDFRFDIGPTFLMMKFLLDEIFVETGRDVADYLQFERLDPMYELKFDDRSIFPTDNLEQMRTEIARAFPGQEAGLDRFHSREAIRFRRMYGCLQKSYSSPLDLLKPQFLKAIPHLSLGRTLFDVLGDYFSHEKLRLAFTFQSKYLGMSPWNCPGAFAMIPYVEYAFGIYHVMGGLSEISKAMGRVIAEERGEVRLGEPVERLLVNGRSVEGVVLEGGTVDRADAVIINADFAHAMTTLFEPGVLKKYTPEKLARRDYSCSTFMLYLGLDKSYDMKHHTIVFAEDYRKNIADISEKKILSDQLSFYVRNASVTDPSQAPQGHSAIYVLVPVANNQGTIDWEREAGPFRERVLDAIASRTALGDIREHIVEEAMITPKDWQEQRNVYCGATFNLAHKLTQMLYLRPRNAFEEMDRCYLVGGGTHPGSGLPTIYESGRISANLISERFGVPFAEPPDLPFR